jgi:hypothetical protein
MGLCALNEMIEFSAVLMVPDTDVIPMAFEKDSLDFVCAHGSLACSQTPAGAVHRHRLALRWLICILTVK